MITVRYGENGSDEGFLRSLGSALSGEPIYISDYSRQYRWNGYDITIVGDFSGFGSAFGDDSQVMLIDYVNTTTGRGQRISGFDVEFVELQEYRDILHFTWAEKVRIYGSNQGELLTGTIIHGLGGDDILEGDYHSGRLSGGDGSDHLWGGQGKDILEGGAGEDFFAFSSAIDSRKKRSDVIVDFVKGEDMIDLHDFDTEFFGKEPDLKWIGGKDFSKKLGELRFERTFDEDGDKITVLEGAIYNRRHVDFRVEFEGHIRFDREDFML